MRADGKKTKDLGVVERAIPHIMSKRVDAQNYVTEYVDEEIIRNYIRTVRDERGIRLTRMSVIIAAYYLASLKHPYVNRFAMSGNIYDRNHFCVSFVILKTDENGKGIETVVKVYLEPDDDIFTINQKINDIIEENSKPTTKNATDKFAAFMLSLPVLPHVVIGLAKILDKVGLLPRFIIDLSPFHTSMFITNLASINTHHIFHHVYEFGTTSVFLSVGKSIPNYFCGDLSKKLIPIGMVLDERICTGYEYAMFDKTFMRYLRKPRMMERREETVSQ